MLRFCASVILIFLTAIGCASQKVKDRETRAQLHMQMGTSHLQQGNYPLALKELLNAEELDPDNPHIQNNLALAYFVRNKLNKAEEHFRKALVIDGGCFVEIIQVDGYSGGIR